MLSWVHQKLQSHQETDIGSTVDIVFTIFVNLQCYNTSILNYLIKYEDSSIEGYYTKK